MVLYDYEAQTSEELTIKEGQAFYVFDNQSDPDWWWGSNGQGVGLVPATYVGQPTEQEALPVEQVGQRLLIET